MIYRRISSGRSSVIMLLVSATAILCLNPRSTAAQALEPKPAPTDQKDAPVSPKPQGDKLQTTRRDLKIDSLPLAPLPAEQAQAQPQSLATPLPNQLNQQ